MDTKPRGSVIVIGGGARSGKSSFALERATTLGQRRVFVATARASDADMAERIARHRRERGAGFTTIEAPLELVAALEGAHDADVVVVDCITLWLANWLLQGEPVERILARVDALVAVVERRARHVVLVTNEVGMGVVPDTPIGRAFRDLSGFAHQRIVRAADEIYCGMMGTLLRLRPAPVALQEHGASR